MTEDSPYTIPKLGKCLLVGLKNCPEPVQQKNTPGEDLDRKNSL